MKRENLLGKVKYLNVESHFISHFYVFLSKDFSYSIKVYRSHSTEIFCKDVSIKILLCFTADLLILLRLRSELVKWNTLGTSNLHSLHKKQAPY